MLAGRAVTDNPESEVGLFAHDEGHRFDQDIQVFFNGKSTAVKGHEVVGRGIEKLACGVAREIYGLWYASGNDGDGASDLVSTQPFSAEFAGGDDVPNAVVIIVGVFGDFVFEESVGEEGYVVGVFVIESVVGGDEGDIV